MGRFSIPPGLMDAAKHVAYGFGQGRNARPKWTGMNPLEKTGYRTGQAAGAVGANVNAGIQLAKDHPSVAYGIAVSGALAGVVTAGAQSRVFEQSNQANPRPTTPTPAEDAGSVSPTAPVASPSRSGVMTGRGTQSLGQVRPGYTPPTQSGRLSGSPSTSKPSAQSDGNFISRATDGLNRFIQERMGGDEMVTYLGNTVRITKGEQQRVGVISPEIIKEHDLDTLDGKPVATYWAGSAGSDTLMGKAVDGMSKNQFRWGEVDRKWAGVDAKQMESAGVSRQELLRYAMESAPQGTYKYRGSNQAIVDEAVHNRNTGQSGSFQVPVAQGQEHILNEYIQKRLAQKGMKR